MWPSSENFAWELVLLQKECAFITTEKMQYIHLLFTSCAFVSTLLCQFPTVKNNIPKNKYQKGGKSNSFA